MACVIVLFKSFNCVFKLSLAVSYASLELLRFNSALNKLFSILIFALS